MSNDPNFLQILAVVIVIGICVLLFMRVFLFRAFGSLVAWLLARQAGRVVIALVLLAGGSFFLINTGGSSAYQQLPQDKLAQLQALPGSDGVYLFDPNDPFIAYVIDQADFQGYASLSTFLFSGNLTSLTYDANNVSNVYMGNDDVSVTKGYHVLQFTLGNITYSSATYQANPNEPIQGAWLLGLGLALAGLLWLIFTLALSLWRQQQAKMAAMTPPGSPFFYAPYQTPGTPQPGSPPMATPQPGFPPTTMQQGPADQAFWTPETDVPPGPPKF